MVEALAASRAETEDHIASLERTNSALAQARDDLVRSEKLATVGHLAAGMAHEINNPVAIMVEEAGWIQDLLAEDDPATADNLAEIHVADFADAERIDDLKTGRHGNGRRCGMGWRKRKQTARGQHPKS